MEPLSLIADIIGVLGAVFALFAWLQARRVRQELEREKARQNHRVKIILQSNTHKIELPFELRRAETTRAEILGRIGMIPMKEKGKRFTLEYTNTRDFLRQVNEIIDADGATLLIISCTEAELDQFDMVHFQHLFGSI